MYTPIHKNKSEIPSFSLEKANGTRKYCMDCSCPGFPYCFARVYPLKKLDSIYMKKRVDGGEKICSKCGCTSCKYGKLDKWTPCKYCRQFYLSDLHCRWAWKLLFSLNLLTNILCYKLIFFLQVSQFLDSRSDSISTRSISPESLSVQQNRKRWVWNVYGKNIPLQNASTLWCGKTSLTLQLENLWKCEEGRKT